MNKLMKLKRWLTLQEVAEHLSTICEVQVSVDNILQLALDRQLTLSVIFVSGAAASLCVPAGEEIVKSKGRATDAWPFESRGSFGVFNYTPDGQKFEVSDKIVQLDIDHPYDLAMIGGEREHIRRMYFKLEMEPHRTDSIYVMAGQEILQLKAVSMEHDAFKPTGKFPPDSMLVVTRSALLDLEQTLNDDIQKRDNKVVGTAERSSLLTILGVVCAIADIDLKKTAKAASKILMQAETMGVSIGETTIEDHLKKVPRALEARKK
jgi:hypothetical protein